MPDESQRAWVKGEEIDRVFVLGSEAEFIFGNGTQIMPHAGIILAGISFSRVVPDAGKNWFEFGFEMDMAGMGGGLSGNAGAGWTDPGNYLRLAAQYSVDLVSWSMGKFSPAPVPVVSLGSEVYQYWGRAANPQDAAVKTGALFFANTDSGDARNNGFTSVVIAGVSQALSFPYDMTVPGTAARLQADLIAAGWPGTVVTGTTALDWTVSIPSVNYTAYSQSSMIGFPGYLVPDVFGNLTQTIDSINATGTFVDASGVPIVTKAFARLRISRGTRYGL